MRSADAEQLGEMETDRLRSSPEVIVTAELFAEWLGVGGDVNRYNQHGAFRALDDMFGHTAESKP
jgi:hypothetical protein